MSALRAEADQVAGLRLISGRIPVVRGLGDVPAMRLPDGTELVWAVAGYDLWRTSPLRLLRTNLSLPEARAIARGAGE